MSCIREDDNVYGCYGLDAGRRPKDYNGIKRVYGRRVMSGLNERLAVSQ